MAPGDSTGKKGWGTSAQAGRVHLCKRTGIASTVTDASIWGQVQVGGGSTAEILFRLLHCREVGSETTSRGRRDQGAGSWEEKGESKK